MVNVLASFDKYPSTFDVSNSMCQTDSYYVLNLTEVSKMNLFPKVTRQNTYNKMFY